MEKLWPSMTRTKQLDTEHEGSLLLRCLTTFDLTVLGLGIFIGCGIFVMTGMAVKEHTGPSVPISFLIAGIAAFLSALCYAEFASYVQRAGSIYVYTYATVGEFCGFLVGWNTLLLYTADVAAEVKAFSMYIDSLFNGVIRNNTIETFGEIKITGFSTYPDFLALGILVFTLIMIALGITLSVNISNIVTIISAALLVVISVMGYAVADGIKTWTDTESGGFFPFGFEGTLKGAALLFYTYIGCDCLPLMAEDAAQPTKSIPRALLLSLVITIILYICASTSLGLMVPYFDIDITSPYASAFAQRGISWAKYVVAAATITAGSTAVLGLVVSLIRLPYAISCDGLLFQSFSYIHQSTKAPVISMVVFGTFSGILTLIVDLEFLMFGVSASAMLNFITVSACVIYLRYTPAENKNKPTSVTKIVRTCRLDSDTDPADDTEYEDEVFVPDDRKLVKQDKTSPLPQKETGEDRNPGSLRKIFQSVPLLQKLQPGKSLNFCTILPLNHIHTVKITKTTVMAKLEWTLPYIIHKYFHSIAYKNR